MPDLPHGLITPLLTPFSDNLTIADDLFADLALRVLDEGCAGLAPFGTTGEGLSVASDERVAAIKGLIGAGVPADRMMPGTGLNSLTGTIALSRSCLDLGCAGVMVLAPFFFKDVGEEGLYRYFEALLEAIAPGRVCLYHIPQVAGTGLPVPVVARLRADFPDQVVAIKDSSGDWQNTEALLAIPGLDVYPGTELSLEKAVALGSPGCISASANINARAIASHLAALKAGEPDAALAESVRSVRMTLEAHGFIAAPKRLLAARTGDARWVNVRPPLGPADAKAGETLAAALAAADKAAQPA